MDILHIRPLADMALTLDLAEAVDATSARRVAAAHARLEQAMAAGDLPGVGEVAAAFISVTLHYDCLTVSQSDLIARVRKLLADTEPQARGAGRLWSLPCCYGGVHGLDLADLAAHLGLAEDEIIATHAATVFEVHALGFLPGLPFLSELPETLARPRRTEPRTAVPAGSVAIANRMCVVYPWVSPGGWHILGRCPVPMFDIAQDPPALLGVGDRVQFAPVTEGALEKLTGDLRAGRLAAASFCGAV